MAEKEYIERGALLDEMRDCKYAKPESDFQRGVNASVDILTTGIKHLPTADVVEVVRCKDCRHAYINSFSAQSGIAVCRLWTKRLNGELAIVQQDDFCSYGERKEQE